MTLNYWIKMKVSSTKNTPVLEIPYENISNFPAKDKKILSSSKEKEIQTEVVKLDQTEVVIKKMERKESKQFKKQLKSFEKEWKLLSRVCHPNLVSSNAFSIDFDHRCFAIMVNYYPFGTLKEVSLKLEKNGGIFFDLFIKFASDIARAMDYLHFLGVLHKNLLCENILVANLDLENIEKTVLKLTNFCVDKPKTDINLEKKKQQENEKKEEKNKKRVPFLKKHRRSHSSNSSSSKMITNEIENSKKLPNFTSLSVSPNESENDSSSANSPVKSSFLSKQLFTSKWIKIPSKKNDPSEKFFLDKNETSSFEELRESIFKEDNTVDSLEFDDIIVSSENEESSLYESSKSKFFVFFIFIFIFIFILIYLFFK